MTKAQKLMEAARKIMRVKAWSPSRLVKHKECPQKVLLEDLMKMCPVCFLGRVSGGFDGQPVVCDTCTKNQPEREALDRGSRLDAALTSRLDGATDGVSVVGATEEEIDAAVVAHRESYQEATRHPEVSKLAKVLARTKNIYAQYRIAFDEAWNRLHEDPAKGIWPRGVWGRVVLDVLKLTPKRAIVIDWKSGNIDKQTGQIREKPEYQDSMRAYQIAVLSSHPQAECEATMVFLDAPPKLPDPTKSLPVLKRKDLVAEQKKFALKLQPLMLDDTFAPRPGYWCGWCSFSQRKGGPCQF